MRIQFVAQEQIQLVIDGLNKLYEHMLKIGKIDAALMKDFMEPYFKEAGYREEVKQKGKNYNKSILIIHDSGIGDFIIMSAVIREIRRVYTNSHITLLVNKNSFSLAEVCPYVDELVISSEPLIKFTNFFVSYKKMMDTVKDLLKHRIDVVFNFGQYPSSQLLAYMSGAKERVEEDWTLGDHNSFQAENILMSFFSNFATFKSDFKKLTKPHMNEINLYILQDYSKNKIKNKKLELWLTPMDKFVAETILQPFNGKKVYAVVMGSNKNLSCKRWSPENYAKLINLLLAKEDIIFIILGAASEVEEGNTVTSLVDNAHLINLTEKLSFRQSAAVLNFCDFYIGNDTSLMHAAAAFNIPILSPSCFPADKEMPIVSMPQKYYPYDVPSVLVQPQHSLPECKDSKDLWGCQIRNKPHCINQITPEKMLTAFGYLVKRIEKNAREPLFFS